MPRLRWGILSTATIARTKVIPGMRGAGNCEVVAIASRDRALAMSVAEQLEIPVAHGSYEALLADPDVDAVYIPLPNHLHAEWTIAAARAGKHVLCEKPLALTAAEAERMVAACDAAGMALMEGFMYRHHPSWVAACELVASGRIGELKAVQSFFGYFNPDPANIRNIFDAGGGALYDIGSYCVNLSRMLFGAEPTRVVGSVLRDPVTGTDIVTGGMLEFDAGLAGFICSTRAEDDQRVEIYGTLGRIGIEIPFNIPPDRPTRITITAGGDPPVAPHTEVVSFPTADPYAVQASLFADAILSGRPVPVPPADAVANLRVIEQLFASGAPTGDRGRSGDQPSGAEPAK
jgi:predicted dehydrogenase